MTVAAIDRLVHHATIFEMNVESYRRRSAASRKAGKPQEPVTAQTILIVAPRHQHACQRQSPAAIIPTPYRQRVILIDAQSHPDRRATATDSDPPLRARFTSCRATMSGMSEDVATKTS
jgi:hypothetical protein